LQIDKQTESSCPISNQEILTGLILGKESYVIVFLQQNRALVAGNQQRLKTHMLFICKLTFLGLGRALIQISGNHPDVKVGTVLK
jgi:hypothetical protein